MSDWWSKKLAGENPTPQRTYTTPPTTPPIQMPMQSPAQTQPMQSPQQQGGRQELLDPSRGANEQIDMSTAIRLWKGGEAMRKEGNMTCPDCGSIYVFSRTGRGHNTMINGASPAPRCYECGWNGMYDQAQPR